MSSRLLPKHVSKRKAEFGRVKSSQPVVGRIPEMVRIGCLSAAERQALNRLRRRAVGRVSQRAHMVLLSARGYTVGQIA